MIVYTSFSNELLSLLRSVRILCAAICTASPNCVAYYNDMLDCHEGNGIGLMGAPNSSTTKSVYIDSSLQPGNQQNLMR